MHTRGNEPGFDGIVDASGKSGVAALTKLILASGVFRQTAKSNLQVQESYIHYTVHLYVNSCLQYSVN